MRGQPIRSDDRCRNGDCGLRPLDRPSPATSAISLRSLSAAPVLLTLDAPGHWPHAKAIIGAGLRSLVPTAPLNRGERAQCDEPPVVAGDRGSRNPIGPSWSHLAPSKTATASSECHASTVSKKGKTMRCIAINTAHADLCGLAHLDTDQDALGSMLLTRCMTTSPPRRPAPPAADSARGPADGRGRCGPA